MMRPSSQKSSRCVSREKGSGRSKPAMAGKEDASYGEAECAQDVKIEKEVVED